MPLLESQTVTKGVLELTVSVPVDELLPSMQKAAYNLQMNKALPGFRPGKASYEAVRQAYGAMAVLEGALKFIVPAAYAEIITREHFQTIGEPEFQVLKLSPEQPVEFSAKVALLPDVKLGDYTTIRVKAKQIEIPDSEVNDLLNELRDMRATTKQVDRAATKDDRVIIDLDMTLDNVALEGGQAKNHTVDLFRPHVIPGFADALAGLKAGENKKFSLPFPEDHYDKKIAGRNVDYEVTVKGVHEFERAALTDEFAKSVGNFENVDALKKQLRENLSEMHATREAQRLEREIMDELIKRTRFGDIPEILVQAELQRLLWRMQTQVEREGGVWSDYLEHMKKSETDLMREMLPEAYNRVKAELIVRAVAEAEHIEATPAEIEDERQIILSHYPTDDDADIREEVKSPDYNSHIKHLILTRKVLEKLKHIATQ